MLNFGYVEFEMPVRHLSGDIKDAVGYMSPTFIGVVRAGDEHFLVVGI